VAQSGISGEAIIGIVGKLLLQALHIPSIQQNKPNLPPGSVRYFAATLCIIALFLPIGLLGNHWIQQRRARRKSAKELEAAQMTEVPVLLKEPSKAFFKN
jgi:hypothetical protein